MSDNTQPLSDQQKAEKIQSLREMITSAETTIHSAKAMLLQLEGKKKAGRKRKIDHDEPGHVVQGAFDGQVMIGSDGKQYPVPANYASKSKLVEGDLLKLTITPEGHFIYKQVGPAPRHNVIGIIGQDASGNYFVSVDNKTYKVLLAAITYFKVEPGDEVVAVVPQEEGALWAAIENVLQHNSDPSKAPSPQEAPKPTQTASTPKTATEILTTDTTTHTDTTINTDAVDEWVPDIDAIEQEIRAEMTATSTGKDA